MNTIKLFHDRFDAGTQLIKELESFREQKDVVILAIPRGGVQVGYVLAKELKLKLDVVFVNKITHPFWPELTIGAVSLKDSIIDEEFLSGKEILEDYIRSEEKFIREILRERHQRFYSQLQPLPLEGKTIILIDDGLATGRSICLTIQLLKKQKPKKIVLAVPVAPLETLQKISQVADQVICLSTPDPFFAIGQFYEEGFQMDDEEASELLKALG